MALLPFFHHSYLKDWPTDLLICGSERLQLREGHSLPLIGVPPLIAQDILPDDV